MCIAASDSYDGSAQGSELHYCWHISPDFPDKTIKLCYAYQCPILVPGFELSGGCR